jgi:hypothetical protein
MMCTRANRASVPESAQALIVTLFALVSSLVFLIIALLTVPFRVVGSRPTKHGRAASTRHVEVQVHLNDGHRVRAIERSCRDALNRAARTWAPFVLPLDRVEVLSSAPPLGKVDIYERWVSPPPDASSTAGSLVVVSLGIAAEARELTPDQIAGALAGQIERLVIDRYQREHPKEPIVTTPAPAEPSATIAASPRVAVEAAPDVTANPDNLTDIRTVREHMELIRKGLPVPPAGPPKNVTRAEPEPVA